MHWNERSSWRRRPLHFHRNLAMSKRFAADDPQLPVIEKLADGMTSLDELDQMELQFALGKAYADLGRQEEALHHLIGANALKRKRLKYDATVALDQINRIREIFTPEFIREKSDRGQPSDLPVFIVGMPRSGSTLIEQILASHPVGIRRWRVAEFRAGGERPLRNIRGDDIHSKPY